MKRFIEHVKLANKGSKRKFPELYGRAMENRIKQLYKNVPVPPGEPIYTGSYHVVCVAGLSQADGSQAERYLIKKHSLSSDDGLNMV